MTEREAFEKWASASPGSLLLPLGAKSSCAGMCAYISDRTESAWLAWQASRKQTLEDAERVCGNHIPLGCSTSMVDVSRSQGVRACIDAIRFLATPTPSKGQP